MRPSHQPHSPLVKFLKVINSVSPNLDRRHLCCRTLSHQKGKMVLHAKPLEKLWAISSWCHFRRFWCSRSIQSSPTRTQLHRRFNISKFESNFTWARIFGAETSLTKSRTFFAITSRLDGYVSFSCFRSISAGDRASFPWSIPSYLAVNWKCDLKMQE